jgi:hypothetical protein
MAVTERQLNRATLSRQMLLRRERISVSESVHRLVALQAQSPASPYIALWNRIERFDPGELDRAFADHSIIRASLMRIAIHAVDAADYPAFHEAMQTSLRGARLNDPRFKSAGITKDEADALLPEVLRFASTARTTPEVEAWLDERLGTPPSRARVWWAMRHYGPFVHAPTGGSWSFGDRNAYVGAPEQRRSGDRRRALATLIRRYLEGFGPATAQDFRQFGMILMPEIKAALELLSDEVVPVDGPGRMKLLDVPAGAIPDGDVPAPPRLLGMWDEALLAYADRSRIIPPEHRSRVVRINGDVLPTLLVDGFVAGVWRAADGGIEATAFHRLSDDAWEGLEAEARSLLAFLADRDPLVYGRYGHWWDKQGPGAEVRILGR